MKRGRKDLLTGGSGDVNPQYLSGRITQTSADATTSVSIPLPVSKIPQANQATIIEILKIYVDFNNFFGGTAAIESDFSRKICFSTINFGGVQGEFNEPNLFCQVEQKKRGAFTALGTYYMYEGDNPFVFDLTDGAGHGLLIATDNIFGQASSNLTTQTNVINYKILYRFKTVGLLEYVGIVQSQQ